VAPADDGPRDPYGGSSPACWAAFNAITARDDGGAHHSPKVHQLIVDAYMSQHATFETPAARRSVLIHLVGLCLALERGMNGAAVRQALGQVFPDKRDVTSLAPKPPAGSLTVASLRAAADREDHDRRGRAWAESVWNAWAPHHARIRALAAQAVDSGGTT
jgi:hypothetical protein